MVTVAFGTRNHADSSRVKVINLTNSASDLVTTACCVVLVRCGVTGPLGLEPWRNSQRKEVTTCMATNKQRLLKAVRLLDEIMERLNSSMISRSGQGSSRVLLVRLKRVRKLLHAELEQPEPSWGGVVGPLFREAIKWLGELVINNLQYLFRPRLRVCWLRLWDSGSR